MFPIRFALLLFFGSICLAYGQSSQKVHRAYVLPAGVKKEIDLLFKQYANLKSPGYAVGIVNSEGLIYKSGYGSANLDFGLPITSHSAFDIASVSKQFTAACIALLIMDGKIDLNMPATRFIPELAKFRDTVRIMHLVYNTSGIIDYYKLPRPDGYSWITFHYFDNTYCIETSLRQDTLAFEPGTRWDYCNVNYMLLAKIVEKASGLPFKEFARTRLFNPLKMGDTRINDDNTEIIPNRATPYNPRTAEIVDAYKKEGIYVSLEGEWIQHARNSPHYGGSGVSTTVDDLAKWSRNFFTQDFGGAEFYRLMHQTHSFKHDRNNQAFGLYFGTYKEKEFVAWDGGDFGVSAQMIRFPKEQCSIIVLSNRGDGKAAERANQVADILIKHKIL